jgi:hypothetical protein
MMALDSGTYDALTSIFSSPAKEERHAHIDDEKLLFNDKWNALDN